MTFVRENAAPGKHHTDGPPRLNSSRCRMNHTAANAFNQSSLGVPSVVIKQAGDKMSQDLAEKREAEFSIIEQVVMQGDLSKLSSEQRVTYYNKVCASSGLNPLTNPFAYIFLNGKLTLYAKKDCTEQLRKINGVSIEELDDKLIEDIYVVTAKAKDKTGRIDQAKGAVVLGNLKGEARANAIMKAETKAKRRVTLSICGMGFTDASEIESIPNAETVDVDYETGEIKGVVSKSPKPSTAPINHEIEDKPKLSAKQIAELEMILNECDDKYKSWVYEYVKKTCRTEDLTGVPAEMFERMKVAALKNMEQNYERLTTTPNEIRDDELAEVAQ